MGSPPLSDLDSTRQLMVRVPVTAGLAAALTYAFHRPATVARTWSLPVDALRSSIRNAMLASVAFAVTLTVLDHAFPAMVFEVALTSALVMDAFDEWRARAGNPLWTRVRAEHRPYAATRACALLAEESIPVFARSARQRVLMQWLAPYVPIELFVPATQAKRARKVLLARSSDAIERRPGPVRFWPALAMLPLAAAALAVWIVPAAIQRAQTQPVEPVMLEFKLLVDEANPFEGFDEKSLPALLRDAGVTADLENVPLGQGVTEPRFYMRLPSLDVAHQTAFLEWLEDLPRPPATYFALGQYYEQHDKDVWQPVGWRTYLLREPAEITGLDVADAMAHNDSLGTGAWYVNLTFTPEGAARFEQITRDNVKRRFAILVDGEVKSAPEIREAIAGGQARIDMGTGDYEQQRDDALRLEAALRAGAARPKPE